MLSKFFPRLKFLYCFRFLFIIFFIFINFVFININSSFAQQAITATISINSDPPSPKSGEPFTLTLETNNFDLDKSDISWVVNDKAFLKGFGKKELRLSGPSIGSTYKIQAIIKTPEGINYTQNIKISPRSVVLIWQSLDGYVPYWYKGKNLIPRGGSVRVMAVANLYNGNTQLSSNDLLYTWEVNGEIIKSASGVGKNYMDYTTKDEQGDKIEILVTVSPKNSTDSVVAKDYLYPQFSEVWLYKDKNGGVEYQNALSGSVLENDKEFTLLAEPFFFSTDDTKMKDMTYVWTINGIKQTDNMNYKRIFKLDPNQKGEAIVQMKVLNIKKLFQDAITNVKFKF